GERKGRGAVAPRVPGVAAPPAASEKEARTPDVAPWSVSVSRSDPAEAFGFLTIDTTPWSVVSADGKVLGQTPLVGVKLPAGVHVLSLKNPDVGHETTYTVTIEPGKTAARRIGLE